ncbi:MAG: hypothetical protein H0U44_03125 [Flavisolibacter sp.]|nr:hypothetical protein [Flavisolibacter sp.]
MLAIPLLANIVPIAWFVGFDVFVDTLDETFYSSLENLKTEFAVHFPGINRETKVHVNTLVPNHINGDKTALLFSGGLDAFESLTRNIESDPYLVSVRGADIEIKDEKRWADFLRFNKEAPIIKYDRICYVEANLQTFYTHEVDLLVNLGWWGKIQHGMALITLIAPLSYMNKISRVLIASSNTGEVSFGWGSTSETDEKVKWADMTVVHDGFHLRRTEKIENIVRFAKQTNEYINLRVCYSEFRKGYNCSRCAKCQRTMLGFILCGENPNDYGFNVPADFYDLIFKNFGDKAVMTAGVAYEWRCLQEKASETEKIFVLKHTATEKNNIGNFAALNISEIVDVNIDKSSTAKKLKYILIRKYPGLFKFYLNLRMKI